MRPAPDGPVDGGATHVHAAVTEAYRREWAYVLAATVRVSGDIDVAEECAADAFGVPGGGTETSLNAGRESGCDDPLYEGLTLEVDFSTVYPDGACFDGKDGAVVTEPDDGLVLFGAEQALTNDQILRGDNAAVALRLLGQDDRLVWYVPSLDDLVGDDGVGLGSLLPRWIKPGLVLGAIVMMTVILWRSRRLGSGLRGI